MVENFSHNLRSLCADYGSISQICRDIGINRQQFNRYLNGASMPSAHNLRRIARHFDLNEETLFATPSAFEAALRSTLPDQGDKNSRSLSGAVQTTAKESSALLGFLSFVFLHTLLGRADFLFIGAVQ